jgi:hypothetical protein
LSQTRGNILLTAIHWRNCREQRVGYIASSRDSDVELSAQNPAISRRRRHENPKRNSVLDRSVAFEFRLHKRQYI